MTANAGEEAAKGEPFFTLGGNVTGMASMKVSAEFFKLEEWNSLMSQV